jgi:hypothetical protein
MLSDEWLPELPPANSVDQCRSVGVAQQRMEYLGSPDARVPRVAVTPRSAPRLASSQRAGSVTRNAAASLERVSTQLEALIGFMDHIERSETTLDTALPSDVRSSPRSRSPSTPRSPMQDKASAEAADLATSREVLDAAVTSLRKQLASRDKTIAAQRSEIAALRKRVSILERRQ